MKRDDEDVWPKFWLLTESTKFLKLPNIVWLILYVGFCCMIFNSIHDIIHDLKRLYHAIS